MTDVKPVFTYSLDIIQNGERLGAAKGDRNELKRGQHSRTDKYRSGYTHCTVQWCTSTRRGTAKRRRRRRAGGFGTERIGCVVDREVVS